MIIKSIDENLLNSCKNIHFMGIGGSGMFPIVQILHSEGFNITGSDNNETDTIALERKMGIQIYMGQKAENIKDADLIIYSAAIMSDNEELIAAKNSDIPTVERSVMLGMLTKRYPKTIAVSGTHGKTTCSSMITQILFDNDFDPTVVIGGKLPAIGGNGRAGKSDIMVVEACEFVDTFLQLSPDISIILNIDEDHLDYFKTLDNIKKSFNRFASSSSSLIIVNGDDQNSLDSITGIDKKVIKFGLDKSNDFYADNINITVTNNIPKITFDVYKNNVFQTEIELNVPGKHNVLNSLAAYVSADYIGATPEQIKLGLANFRGAGRRFEILGNINGVTIADDYAHHPTELEVTLKAAKNMNYNKVWAVFQPFTFSRTSLLLQDFADALKIADNVLLTQIMGSREKNTYNIYSSDLAEKIEGSKVFDTFEEIKDYVLQNAQSGDLVITLGCGDVYKIAKLILNK